MSKNLVIVESPAKAKTIEGYLGKDYVVRSSFGHVRDLSKKMPSILKTVLTQTMKSLLIKSKLSQS